MTLFVAGGRRSGVVRADGGLSAGVSDGRKIRRTVRGRASVLGRFRWHLAGTTVLATSLGIGAALLPQGASAETLVLGGGDQDFLFGAQGSSWDRTFEVTTYSPTVIVVRDDFLVGDQFEVFKDGTSLGTTSVPPPFSTGTFTIGGDSGTTGVTSTISGTAIQSPYGEGRAYIQGYSLWIDKSQAYFTQADPAAQQTPMTFNGGILQPTGGVTVTFNQPVTIKATGGTLDTTNADTVFNGAVTAAGDFTKTGTGTFTIAGGGSFLGLTNEEGTTIVTSNLGATGVTNAAGAAFIVGSTVVGSSTTLTISGGTFENQGDLTVRDTGTISAAGVNNTAAGTVENYGTITAANVNNTGTGTIENYGSINGNGNNSGFRFRNELGGVISGNATNTGNTFVNAGEVTGNATNSGTSFTNSGTIDGDAVNTANTFANSGLVKGNANNIGGTFDNTGTINGTASNSGLLFTNEAAGIIKTNASNSAGTFQNNGVIGTGAAGTGNAVNTGTGLFVNTNQILANATNSGTSFSNSGTIGANATNTGGAFVNAGTIGGDATNTGGTFDNTNRIKGTASNSGTTFTNAAGAVIETNASNSAGTFQNDGVIGTGAAGTGNAVNSGTGLFVNTNQILADATNSGTSFSNSGTIGANATNTGGAFVNAGTIGGDATNTGGTFDNTNRIKGTASNSGTTFTNVAGAVIETNASNSAGTFQNDGVIGTGAAGTGNAVNSGTGLFVNTNQILADATNSGTSFTNSGTIGADAANMAGTFLNAGTVVGVATNSGTGLFTNDVGGKVGAAVNIDYGQFINHGTISGNVVNADNGTFSNTSFNTIVGDVLNTNAAIFANTGGIDGSVTNSGSASFSNAGSIGGDVANLDAATFANSGTIVGSVTNESAFVNSGSIGGALTNLFSFFATGGSIGGDVTNAAGATFTVASTTPASVGGSFSNAGTIEMRSDGTTFNTLNIGGNYTGTGASQANMDVNLSGANDGVRSDVINIAGSVGGSTTLNLYNTSGQYSLFANPITVVTDNGSGAASAFTSTNLPSGGLIEYKLQRQGDNWNVVSQLNPDGAGAAAASVASSMLAIATGFNEPTSAFVSAPPDPVKDQLSFGLWSRVKGGDYNISADTTTHISGASSSVTSPANYESSFFGFQVGADISRANINGSGWNAHVGLTGGDVWVNNTGVSYPGSSDVDAPFFGAYAAITGFGFYADVQVQRNYYDVKLNNAVAGLNNYKLNGDGYSIIASTGKVIPLSSTWFIEPSAGLTYVTASVDDVTITDASGTAGVVKQDDIESVLGSLRVRVGTVIAASDKLILQPSVQASVWHEFSGDANAFYQPEVSSVGADISTSRVGTFGQVGLALSGQLVGTGFLGFVRGDYRFGENINGYSLTGGLRYQW
ncbi:hypothetical protein MWN34_03365 [Ancylobacter sp. 6x-1]|uniref:Autotransporter domain-containing protein n=1 Tax=Ancylobacter crimeensis TaxID=2579147 RepID=A0ABT0D7M2_9HYPH|nr:hypothetical protein [Ancylobacter crimeensis]MCK0195944.1 hypothetical protein [Ancylobacter crimeensis]